MKGGESQLDGVYVVDPRARLKERAGEQPVVRIRRSVPPSLGPPSVAKPALVRVGRADEPFLAVASDAGFA